MKKPTSFVGALHGLRGIAVLYVLLSHDGLRGWFLVPFVAYQQIGKLGVLIFFVLSAFLLTNRLTEELLVEHNKWRSLAAYFVHRVFRIYPLFLIVLALKVTLGNFDFSDLLRHVLLLEGRAVFWAIPVEFKYYFVIPLIALAAAAFSIRAVIYTLGVAAIAAIGVDCLYPREIFSDDIALYTKSLPFLLGSLLALLVYSGNKGGALLKGVLRSLLPWISLGAMLGATVLYKLTVTHHLSAYLYLFVELIMSLAIMGLITVSLDDSLIGRVLAHRALVFFGEVSFSLYLLHGSVAPYIARLPYIDSYARAWLSLGALLLIAWGSYSLIERPGMKTGFQIGRWIKESGQQPPAPESQGNA